MPFLCRRNQAWALLLLLAAAAAPAQHRHRRAEPPPPPPPARPALSYGVTNASVEFQFNASADSTPSNPGTTNGWATLGGSCALWAATFPDFPWQQIWSQGPASTAVNPVRYSPAQAGFYSFIVTASIVDPKFAPSTSGPSNCIDRFLPRAPGPGYLY